MATEMIAAETAEDAPDAPKTTTPVDEARARVDELHRQEWDWCERYSAACDQEAETRRTSGAAVLADPSQAGKIAAILAHVRDERDIAREAISEASRLRREAISTYFETQGQAQRAEAAKLNAEADQRQAKTDDLLAQLKEFEGCDYAPAVTGGQPLGNGSMRLIAGIPETKSLRERAKQLIVDAADWQRRIPRGGGVTATSRDELRDALRAYSPLVITPIWPDVDAWLAGYETKAAEFARRGEWQPGGFQTRITLDWLAGQISGSSTVKLYRPNGDRIQTSANW